MTKKVTISVLSVVLLLAGCFGLYLFFDSKNAQSNNIAETFAAVEVYLDEDKMEQDYIVDEMYSEETEATEFSDDFVPSDDSLSDNTADVVTTNFTINRIVDHTTDEQVSGRVVFGKSFDQDANYITFDSENNFEINLSGYLDEVKKGKYTLYDSIIYVEFEDGKAAEYVVQYTDEGIISYIIVNYGDYDVYFS